MTDRILFVLFALAMAFGLSVPLMENDAAQFAVMSQRMNLAHDFWSLYKGTAPYLDKPHLHFWLSAWSMKLFGLTDWAYRLPSLAALWFGGYSVYRWSLLAQPKHIARWAALIFLSAYSVVLASMDVRTDAVLTASVAWALWQFSDYLVRERWRNLVWGALATAMAFSAKGQLGVVLVGLPVLAQLWHTRKWYLLFRWPALLGLGVFALGISPVLYAYYLQFDLHPELVIRGIDQRSGVFFILWEQSFERMSGTGMGSNSPDYLFFFHTFLWVFLPWTLVGVYAWVDRWRQISSARSFPESMTFIGVTAIMVLISFAQFKLPHYLNGTLPIWAVLSAPYLSVLSSKKPWVIAQKTLLTAVLICSGVLVWAFGTGSELGVWVALVGVVALPRLWRSSTGMIWRYTALIFGGLYLMMHLFFYPNLLAYQSGVSLAKAWHKDRATGKEAPIYKLSDQFTWSLDFYTHQPLVLIDSTQISTISQGWLYTEIDPNILLKNTNRNWTLVEKSPHFRITRLNWPFLNPQTRTNQLSYRYLIWLSADR